MATNDHFFFRAGFQTYLLESKKTPLNILQMGSDARRAFRFKLLSDLKKQNPEMEQLELIELSEKSLKNTSIPEYVKTEGTVDRKFIDSLDESHIQSFDIVFNSNFRPVNEPILDKEIKLPSSIFFRGYLNETFELDGEDYFIHERFQSLLNWTNLLNESGYLFLEGVQVYSGRIPNNYIDPISEKMLNSKGFYLNAFLQEVPNYQMRGKRAYKTILVISRNNMNGSIFVGDLSEEAQLVLNFFAGNNPKDEELNLAHGYFLNREEFYTLEQLRSTDRAEKSIFFNYEGYRQVLFKDLVGFNNIDDEDAFDEILSTLDDVTDDHEHDDMRLLAFWSKPFDSKKLNTHNLAICLAVEEDWTKLRRGSVNTGRYDYMFFIVPKSIHARYLEIFFESELGRQIYQSNLKIRDRNRRLSTDEIRNLRILIPEEEELLENTVKAYEKINELNRSIGKLKDNFFQNPKKSVNNDINLLDDMLLSAGALNEEDEILALIRREEGLDIEFKQTYRLPVVPKGVKLEDSVFTNKSNLISAGVIKVINSFINTNGGTLLIGVKDSNHTITGLEDELQYYFAEDYPEMKEQQDRFKEFFKRKLQRAFMKNFLDDNIEFKFLNVQEKWIFKVECVASDKPCFIQESAKLENYIKGTFFYRTGSESMPLRGQELADYLEEHFYSNDKEN